MSSDPKTFVTEEEYLAVERRAESRSEFFNGEMFALAGASRRHNMVVTNLVIALGTQLRDRPCNVYSNDMRVRVKNIGLFTYPDVVVTCGEEEFADDEQDTLLNPSVILEVLSALDRSLRSGQEVRALPEHRISVHLRAGRPGSSEDRTLRQAGGRKGLGLHRNPRGRCSVRDRGHRLRPQAGRRLRESLASFARSCGTSSACRVFVYGVTDPPTRPPDPFDSPGIHRRLVSWMAMIP